MSEPTNVTQLQQKGNQWNTITSVLIFFIQFVVSYFLNKIILPNEFGKAIWAFAIVGFGYFLSHFSWFEVLVRKEKVSKQDEATGFTISILSNLFLFCIFFFGANTIAKFTEEFNAASYIKAYSFIYILLALSFLPLVKLTRDIAFTTISKINLSAKLISSLCAIGLALIQRPFLSLFFLYMGADLFTNFFLIFATKWKPKFNFSKTTFLPNKNLAATLTLQKLAGGVSSNLDSILIGQNYTDGQVAHYTKPYGVRSMPVSFIARSISKVTFPTLSKLQHSPKAFTETFFNTQHFLGYLLFPLFGMLIALAKPFSVAYFSPDWDIQLVTKLLQIFAFAGMLASFNPHFSSLLQIKASNKQLNAVTFSQNIIFILLLIVSLPLGLIAIAVAKLLSALADFLIFSFISNKHLEQGYFSSLKGFLPTIFTTTITAGASYALYSATNHINIQSTLYFIGLALVYGLLYLGLSYFIDQKGFNTFKETILNKYV